MFNFLKPKPILKTSKPVSALIKVLSSFVKSILGLTFLLSLQYCKEPSEIGLDLIDNQAGFNTTDTITLWAYSERDDSIPTSLVSQHLLGQMIDPVFGKVRATIFSQFSLPPSAYGDIKWGKNPALDSVLLVLAYSPKIGADDDSTMYYGNLEVLKTLRVYELSQSLPNKDTIYSNQQIPGSHTLVGQRVFVPAPYQRIPFGKDTLAYLSIRLNDSFGQKFINADSINYTNWIRFHNFFKGLKVGVQDNFLSGGSILNFNIHDMNTGLIVYYKSGEGDERKQTQRSFTIDGFSRRYTHVEFDYQTCHPVLATQLNAPTQRNDSLLFASSLGGLRVRLRMPHIDKLGAFSNVVINQARLIIPVDKNFIGGKEFHAARELILLKRNKDGKVVSIRDQELSASMFGGKYNSKDNQYEFNITQHLQQVLDGKTDNDDLLLFIRGSSENAERVVLRGPGRHKNPMRVSIRYTTF